MAEPFIGEIRIMPLTYAPVGWAFCDGSLLSIAEYSTLYSILATNYGGDGRTNFALPNFKGRVPLGVGRGPGLTPRNLGEMSGAEVIPLDIRNIPEHTHAITNVHTDAPEREDPATMYIGKMNGNPFYADASVSSLTQMNEDALSYSGQSQPHENRQPSLILNYFMALDGTYPARN